MHAQAMLGALRHRLLGAPRDPRDPHIHRHLALIAFFAWVGLGSDGLSSSSYGPEEIYRQLAGHPYLALWLVGAIVVTVFLIAASYMQVIEAFPGGGGGYLVATKLLGAGPGVVSGGALVVDYVLTIAISIAAGCDAIFSFAPPAWQAARLPVEFGVLGALALLNLRGVKESVAALTPIFLVFLVTHAGLIGWALLRNGAQLGGLFGSTVRDTHAAGLELGALGVAAILLRAFSLGGGTYTGIEAVSNGVGLLREPRVANGKRTMAYMAVSLALTAGGILLAYLLERVAFEPGRTLNATLWSRLTEGFHVGGIEIGPWLVVVTLLSEGALLFVAAQTGFLDGPRTLAAMAADGWVPRRFQHLSERLVTQNGVVAMTTAAALVLAFTGGAVGVLVVMYSINVFLTFTLTQIGMTRHGLAHRGRGRARRVLINAVGAVVTATILVVTVSLKFGDGGWVTLLVTGGFIAGCALVRRHYRRVREHLASLDAALLDLPLPEPARPAERAPDGPTAIVLVEGWNGLGVHTVLSIERLMPGHFRNWVFVSAGLVDSAEFKGVDEMAALEARVVRDLDRYVALARRLGRHAEHRHSIGIDPIQQLEATCVTLAKALPRPMVFAGQLVFQRENLFTRTLHHQTAFAIQRRLQFLGIQAVLLPIRVWNRETPEPEDDASVALARARAGSRSLRSQALRSARGSGASPGASAPPA